MGTIEVIELFRSGQFFVEVHIIGVTQELIELLLV
jgi:hypothetical protein